MKTVSEKALIQRINRKLSADSEMLRRTRGTRARLDLGEHYVHDVRRNLALQTDVEPEVLARELGVLQNHESVRG